ncbi:hypothetical protein ACN27F_15625 [Solwaraspora sp. WMMB335]|uniref:hypothetical protein n=1 Tax=Solwaraspora sp. WMMB335 TaxID=3404118 RepID=UPI003B92D87A
MSMPPAASPGDWADYAAAARRLDRLRRGNPDQPVLAQDETELTALRHRLARQRQQLLALGVPATALEPLPAEVAACRSTLAADGAGARQAVRVQVASALDTAATSLARTAPATGAPAVRNLLVYGPFAAITLVIQVALFVAAGQRAPLAYVLGCGLVMPLVAFGLGWLAVGVVFAGPGQAVQRTPLVGALACAAPLLLSCVLAMVVGVTR